jgi:hypothetical protein
MPRCLPTVARGMMFWLIFITRAATSQPVQTIDEILQSVGNEDRLLRTDLENMYAVKHKAWYPHVVENEVPARLEFVNRNPRLYVMLNNQEDTENATTTSTEELDNKRVLDPWSVVWYMASFAGLVSFFLAVSCSECCCSRRTARTPPSTAPNSPVESQPEVRQWVEETPPPPYDLFAPPSYDALSYGSARDCKNKCGVYVVPVHGPMMTMHSTTSSTLAEPR